MQKIFAMTAIIAEFFWISDKEKSPESKTQGLISGGTDGTRTRDPLRDRQVF